VAIYSAIYSGPPRHYGSTRTDKRYIAIHNTSNDATAEGEASYAKRRADSVSSHYYVDNNSILQSLDTNLRAYHAGSTIGNSQAIAYEITGGNSKSRAGGLANVAWPLLARQIATDCREHDIEPRLLTVAEIRAGSKTGIITHDQMRQAWGGTTHTDPGPNFPLDHLLAVVQAEMEDDMTPEQDRLLRNVERILTTGWSGRDAEGIKYTANDPGRVLKNPLTALEAKLAELAARPQDDVDEAALAAALAPLLEQGASADEIAAAVTATLAAKLGG
jgi:N-acetyl-anhydromuramyl-L-alanine amidase AmpD